MASIFCHIQVHFKLSFPLIKPNNKLQFDRRTENTIFQGWTDEENRTEMAKNIFIQ